MKQIEDEKFLKMVEALLDVYLTPTEGEQLKSFTAEEVDEIEAGNGKISAKEFVDTHNPVIGIRPDGTEVHAKEAKDEYARRREDIRAGNFQTVAQLKEEKKTW